MWYQLLSYIKFCIKSTNKHGVHSPFVYDFVTKCLYNKSSFEDYSAINSYIQKLRSTKTLLHVTDLGAGSRVFKTDIRSVSSIAKHAGTSLKEAKLLYRISNHFKPLSILELGTSLGIATHALSFGSTNAQVTTIEGCRNITKFTKTQFELLHLDTVNVINNRFNTVLPRLVSNAYDLIFFDGHHEKDATLTYFEILLPTAHNNSIWILDDIYWSKEMTEAWKIIKQHPEVTVTIDVFQFGLVFFRKEQAKEDFVIRI